jgi:hypothetical protein
VRFGGARDALSETEEDTVGEVVQVNTDDDDGDAVSRGTPAEPEPDWKDTDGCVGENDLVELKLRQAVCAATPGLNLRLHFASTNIAVWQDANKMTRVLSDTTAFPADRETSVYVEGLHASASAAGESVSLRLYQDASPLCGEDTVRLIVPRMIFVLWGTGVDPAGIGVVRLHDYLNHVGSKDSRSGPYIMQGSNGWHSVWIWNTQVEAQLALSAENGYVYFEGHSNEGLGLAFADSPPSTLADLWNVAEECQAVEWSTLRGLSSGFTVTSADYGDDPATVVLCDPWSYTQTVVLARSTNVVTRYQNREPASGGVQHVGYYVGRDLVHLPGAGGVPRVIVKCGSHEMPTRRWKKLCLRSCSSMHYYLWPFQHGTVFVTRERAILNDTSCPRRFVQGVLEDWSDEVLWNDLHSWDTGAKLDYVTWP